MRVIILILALALTGCSDQSQHGNGHITENTRPLPPFEQVSVSGNFNIKIACGGKQLVTVKTDDNLHTYIDMHVKHGILFVEPRETLKPSSDNQLAISAPNIRGVHLDGEHLFTIENVQNNKLVVTLTGHNHGQIRGTTKRLTARLDGKNHIHAGQLSIEKADLHLVGNNHFTGTIHKSYSSVLSGNNTVLYYGKARANKHLINGVGMVRHLNRGEIDTTT